MTEFLDRSGLSVDSRLADFVEQRALPGTGLDVTKFWEDFADLLGKFAPENAALLAKREDLQAQIDGWHEARAGQAHDAGAYQAFLRDIGYLVPEPAAFKVGTQNVDREIATMAGPQLVVPALNARFALNAANARWGSLYDALYGTDALDAPPARPGGYDAYRGAAVIARAKAFLDEAVPLSGVNGWDDLSCDDDIDIFLADRGQLAGRRGKSYLFCNNGLHIEVVIDYDHPIGKTDPAGIADVVLEAMTTPMIKLPNGAEAPEGLCDGRGAPHLYREAQPP
jgi:malate synthase